MKGLYLLTLLISIISIQSFSRLSILHRRHSPAKIEHHKQFLEKQKARKQHQSIVRREARRKLHPRRNSDKFPLKGIRLPGLHRNMPKTTPLLEKILNKDKRQGTGVSNLQANQFATKTATSVNKLGVKEQNNRTAFKALLGHKKRSRVI